MDTAFDAMGIMVMLIQFGLIKILWDNVRDLNEWKDNIEASALRGRRIYGKKCGMIMRPDMAFLDDPQATGDSAKNEM